LFVCEHNAGRSQLAAGLATHRAGGRVNVLPAGTTPDAKVSAVKPGLAINPPAGTPYLTWPLPDPANWDIDGIRPLRDQIDGLVQNLIDRLISSSKGNRLIGERVGARP
jgi:protein-tyrosine-phosphatase